VTPDKKKPFIIQVAEAEIRVVGTSFNVRNKNALTEVIVETGIVQVTYRHKTVQLKAHERILVSPSDTILRVLPSHENLHQYYRSRLFVCDNTKLSDLVAVLSEAYNKKIIIAQPSWRDLALTTTFNQEPLDNILNIIAQTLDITYVREGDTIIFK
jgi:transmembrane sensor